MYFKNFDQIYYDYEINGNKELIVVTDIVKNVRFRKEILANISVYDEYDIRDGETPEIIAEKIYGNASYHWIIMLVNERYDYVNDFPLTQLNLETHVKQKYGVNNMYATHHYINEAGYIVNSTEVGAFPISNYQYEENLNESKRRIKIVSKSLINTIIKNFKSL
jgi:hypothetical protein